MRWVYKIWSGFDGFRPAMIESRLQSGNLLDLGWAKYADAVEIDDEVWVFFFQGDRFPPGVYAQGHVESIDVASHHLVIEVAEYSPTTPLTDSATSSRLRELVSPRKRQVFLLPEKLGRRPAACSVGSLNAPSCQAKQCLDCGYWRNLPIIRLKHLKRPRLMTSAIKTYTPAYWAIPKKRNFVSRRGLTVRPGVKRTNELFYRLKSGEAGLAYLFAAGMAKALRRRADVPEFDAVVPVPLSPEKAVDGEFHRTLALASHLAPLLGVPLCDALTLSTPISKRLLLNQGHSQTEFKRRYVNALVIDSARLAPLSKVLIVDDVGTQGHTLGAIAAALTTTLPDMEVHAATGAQFALGPLVRDVQAVLAKDSRQGQALRSR
jgi:hypothetical protein